MFDGLHDVSWASMEHAYGSAAEVPWLIEGLAAPEAEVREKALDRFYTAVHFQGDVYACTVASLPFLFELAGDPAMPGRGDVVRLLASIGQGAILSDYGVPERFHAAAVMRGHAGTFLRWASDDDFQVRFEAIGMLGFVLDDPAPLRALFTRVRTRAEQLQVVDAVGALSGLWPLPIADTESWLTTIATDPSAAPELRLAATVEHACLVPSATADEVLPAATALLAEIAALPAARRAETEDLVGYFAERLHLQFGPGPSAPLTTVAPQPA